MTAWSFGGYDVSDEEASKHVIWSNRVQKFEVPQRVAQRQPNPFGLYDMHGNMWEYVADWWHRYSYKEAPLNDPTGPALQSEKNDLRRIIRGSSFDWGRMGGDSAYRMRITQRLDPCVVRVAENRFHLYYCSGGQKMKDGKQVWEFQNYVSTSDDGIHWKKEPAPVLPLGAEKTWDAQSQAGPCVLKLEDGFHLWYLGSGELNGKTTWRIGHATSPDGLRWTRSGAEPVLDIGKEGNWDGGTFMSFDIVFRKDEGQRTGRFLFWYAAAPTEHGEETKMTIQIGHGTSQ